MEHVVEEPENVEVVRMWVAPGDTVREGQMLVEVVAAHAATSTEQAAAKSSDGERADVARLRERKRHLEDASRPEAVAKRREKGRRTARENLADLLDEGSFQEYGGFGIAAQRQRRSEEDLIANTPADGLICGTGTVNAGVVEDGRANVLAMSYDYTVLAGTQGYVNHKKTDRVLEVARRNMLPVVLFAEGGGGRPGDTDAPVVAGLDVMSFASFASLSGLVPLVGIASGYCFAGNAALLGCCDVVIATEDSNIGMAGPAMIEGGGLGVVAPTEIGPIGVQSKNGVVDVRVADDVEAHGLLKLDRVTHRLILDAGPLGEIDLAGVPVGARLLHRVRSQQAADHVGADGVEAAHRFTPLEFSGLESCTIAPGAEARLRHALSAVMAGHSRPKDGVASLAYVPAIHVLLFGTRKRKHGCPAQGRA